MPGTKLPANLAWFKGLKDILLVEDYNDSTNRGDLTNFIKFTDSDTKAILRLFRRDLLGEVFNLARNLKVALKESRKCGDDQKIPEFRAM
jgi:hypothetical protein